MALEGAQRALPDAISLAFAMQVWPNAQSVEAPSVSAWARAIAQAAIEQVPGDATWRLHLFGHDHGDCEVNQRRLGLIEESVWRLLKQKQRRLCKTHAPDTQAPLGEATFIVNVAMVTATHGYISIIRPQDQARWKPTLSRFAGGYVHIADDLRPPARAYRKLREALAHIDVAAAAHQTWVDLGAAPGSWSFDSIEAGAQVFAIDRSPLRDDLMQAPNCTFVKTDAFTYRPDAPPVDVLVCDVIAYPERNIALLETWLSEGLCRAFVVTLKFRGEVDYVKVDACKAVLARWSSHYVLRQLYHNKNEVTAAGLRV